jgi:hypothetical protein
MYRGAISDYAVAPRCNAACRLRWRDGEDGKGEGFLQFPVNFPVSREFRQLIDAVKLQPRRVEMCS